MNDKIFKYHIFCDESGLKEDYLTIGGIFFPSYLYTEIHNEINNIKTNDKEIHFNEMQSYVDFILCKKTFDIFVKYKEINFACINYKKENINHSKYNSNQKIKKHQNEQGFHKLYFTFINCCCFVNHQAEYYCYLDKRIPTKKPQDMKNKPDIENIKMYLNWIKPPFNQFKILKWLDSKESNFIQLADLLTGLINFEKNKKHNTPTNSNKYKIQLLNYAKDILNKKEISVSTKYREKKWNIFNHENMS